MGITKDGLLKRRKTGGKPAKYMKKRKHAMGRPPANTKLAESRIHLIRCRGGYIKHRALRLDSGNYAWGSEGITRKARILSVIYNPTNNEFVRTNTLVKGEIVQVDATPFKLWYETYYGVAIGKKVVVKHDRRQSSLKRDSTKRVSVKKSADDKDAKPAAKKDAKPAAKSVAKSAAKPAEKKEEAGKGPNKTINKVKGAKKAAGRKAALIVKKAKLAATRKAKKDAKLAAEGAKKKADGKDAKKDTKKSVKAEDKKSSVGPIAARHTTAVAGAVAGTLTGIQIDQGKSQIVRDKHAKRAARRVLEPIFEEQFASGRLLACISSRPGQHGAADGYLLEGRELEFYLRKTGKGRRSAK